MDETVTLVELSLFPLNTVLFPGQLLPLHIFEDRYRLMIRRCLAEELPFGVVLIKHGAEVGGDAEPHGVGTVARIVESSHLADGTMNIVTVGVDRFRIHHLIHDQPYLRGEVEILPAAAAAPATGALAARVRSRVERYIRLIADAAGLQIQMDQAPETPHQVGYLAAVAMQIGNQEKQEILDMAALSAVLSREIVLLDRENALLEWIIAHREWPSERQFGPGGTLLPN